MFSFSLAPQRCDSAGLFSEQITRSAGFIRYRGLPDFHQKIKPPASPHSAPQSQLTDFQTSPRESAERFSYLSYQTYPSYLEPLDQPQAV